MITASLVTVQEGGSDLSRFDPYNLTLIDKKTFSGYTMSNIAYHQGAYFLSTQSHAILIVNSTNRTVINTVTATGISGVRDMIFLKDGQTMIVASADNGRLFFFNRSGISPRDYKYMSDLTTSFTTPHGLWYVNDTFFYATVMGVEKCLLVCDVQRWLHVERDLVRERTIPVKQSMGCSCDDR